MQETTISIRLSVQLKAEFSEWCADHATTISQQLKAMIEACLYEDVPARTNPAISALQEQVDDLYDSLKLIEPQLHRFHNLYDFVIHLEDLDEVIAERIQWKTNSAVGHFQTLDQRVQELEAELKALKEIIGSESL